MLKRTVRNKLGHIDPIMNSEPKKYYPGGPKFEFNGVQVDCLTFASVSCGITVEILVEILDYFEMNNVFP